MKSFFAICLILMVANVTKAADPVTTDSLARLIIKGNVQIEQLSAKQVKDTGVGAKGAAKILGTGIVPLKQSLFVSNLITFLPVIFFLGIILVILFKLRRDGVKLSDFLIDKDLQITIKKEEVKADVANASANVAVANAVAANAASFQAAGVPPTLPEPNTPKAGTTAAGDQQQSVSRLVAFISGITSVALAVCVTTFYMYRWSIGDKDVNINNLSSVLYGLGLGVIPYGVNKVASALRS